MGRELRRVPMDFDWPLGKVWAGYLDPAYKKCTACNGRGTNASREAFDHLVGLILMAGAGSLSQRRPMHPWLKEAGIEALGTTLHEVSTGLAGRAPDGFLSAHDACDRWGATRKILEAAGLQSDWGYCTECLGEGSFSNPDWIATEPPTGDGYQLWETTSEGSPSSPVFASLDELCAWCEDNATTFGSAKTSKERWRKMLDDGLVCEEVAIPNGPKLVFF